ncbi:MAG TPA: 50S ribosomal protein L9 [Acidimicrobiia bacterium]|nr:50S ribosomal protein L9 [Acidimicrobiia bacterium]HWW45123.1 50S ribosomal protein L9 [Acidimicrobiia bacterium]
MKIVLRADVEHLGRKGDLLEVTDGYARNYLVPRGMAIKATKGAVAQAEAMRRNRVARDARDRDGAEALATQLGAQPLRVTARAGEGGKLFGSVTNADIAAAVHDQLGVELDRRAIELPEPIRDLGAVDLAVRLHPEVSATLHVEVQAG